MGEIYCIENIINGKKYIGLGKNPRQRFIQHRSKLRNNQHANKYFQEDWNKYGEETFHFYIITSDADFETEKNFILEMNTRFPNGYNLTDGGAGLANPDSIVRNGISKNHKNVSGKNNPRFGTKLKNASSKYYGVSIHRVRGKIFWQASTNVNGKRVYIGQKRTEKEAANLYNQYVIKHKLNYPINKIER